VDDRPAVTSANLGIAAIVVLAIAVGGVAVLRIDRSGRGGSGLDEAYRYQIDEFKHIDPALIGYQQTAAIDCAMKTTRAVAVGPHDDIYVAGDDAIHVFDAGGKSLRQFPAGGRPTCLGVGGEDHRYPGRIYLGVGHQVSVFDPRGKPVATWESLGPRAVLTSIAVAAEDVFVADAGNAIVLRYDTEGKLLGSIGRHDKQKGVPGFAVPSPFFDVAVHPDGWLRVTNPGALRVEAYSPEGNFELFWGGAGAAIENFYGCCNPANLAVLPDGRQVTAEKGLLRVKVYSAAGQFQTVVAGPQQLEAPSMLTDQSMSDREYTAVDVAADSRGRVLILDLATNRVRVFVEKAGPSRPLPAKSKDKSSHPTHEAEP